MSIYFTVKCIAEKTEETEAKTIETEAIETEATEKVRSADSYISHQTVPCFYF